jgi:hypothetical protein
MKQYDDINGGTEMKRSGSKKGWMREEKGGGVEEEKMIMKGVGRGAGGRGEGGGEEGG